MMAVASIRDFCGKRWTRGAHNGRRQSHSLAASRADCFRLVEGASANACVDNRNGLTPEALDEVELCRITALLIDLCTLQHASLRLTTDRWGCELLNRPLAIVSPASVILVMSPRSFLRFSN
ncbi:hypothetical protein [Bradyrhizobium sp. UFLA05-112]